jgi:hypothetical protein
MKRTTLAVIASSHDETFVVRAAGELVSAFRTDLATRVSEGSPIR